MESAHQQGARDELVDQALREFVENHKKDVRELRGKITFHPEYDYKRLREGK
jgi:hypothetical protein